MPGRNTPTLLDPVEEGSLNRAYSGFRNVELAGPR
jgi:hypothetical protein